ncbi:hypothetical protein [Micromonospora chalcea]|uniref:hypothetical protein n=1 Tax=Micromonospora chalcea TaxID=1874 RepID=UPI003B97FCF0
MSRRRTRQSSDEPKGGPDDSEQTTRLVRGLPGRDGTHSRPEAPPCLVLAEVATDLPLRSGSALPRQAPNPYQSWPLAGRGRVVKDDLEQAILAVHVRGYDGMCTGCRAWWSRLSPYPCWQVEWATSRQARTITARFLEGVR